ncbi:MAG: PilW family protein [Planctomycetota bacterium]|jgi:type II secretory pathway pseudopilin PulG
MKKASNMCKKPPAFTLVEVLAALVIGTMVLVAVMGVYSRAERSAAAITRSIEGSQLPFEILQAIAEDIDRAVTSGADARVTIDNKFINSIPTSRLTIQTTFNDRRNEEQTFEKIVWQTSYDRNTDGLILYRSHSGVALEDKLLDEQKEDWERELFVPICKGLTFFRILIPAGEDFQDSWKGSALPKGITVSLSFAEPFKTRNGTFDVPESEKIIRTIAVNRTRKIKFNIIKSQPEENETDKDEDEDDIVEDSNEPGKVEDSNKPDGAEK